MQTGAAGRRPLAGSPAAPTCARPHARHLAPKVSNAQAVRWYGAVVDKARPDRWTCSDCHREVQYELMVLGAVWFIRRTDRGGRSIYETVRDDYATAVDLWHRLLAGSAR